MKGTDWIAFAAMASLVVLDHDIGIGVHGSEFLRVAVLLQDLLRGPFGRVEQEALRNSCFTLRVAIMAQRDGGEEVEGLIGKLSLLDLVVRNEAGLRFCIRAGLRYQFLKTLHGPWISKYSLTCLVAS